MSRLATETDYEFRAVADHDGRELRETGAVLSFKTEKSAVHPEINRLVINEISPPNPHADIEVN